MNREYVPMNQVYVAWMSYAVGMIEQTNHVHDGRTFLRAIKARWDDMGCPFNWDRFESTVLGKDPAIAIALPEAKRRAMTYLAGGPDRPLAKRR